MKKFYITTAIPYVNAPPHIGFAMELAETDAFCRYQRVLLKKETLLLSGADENALKNVQEAERTGVPVQKFVDTNSKRFEELAVSLNIHIDVFQKGSNRTTHFPSSQKLWELCSANGDIYKKEYRGLYCVGCETFYAADELDEKGECFEHPGKELEEVAETNYFFKLSKYQEALISLIVADKLKIVPGTRKNEVLSFLKQPLHDISISRSNARAKNWGVPVPGDQSQRMYVWFDALNIYQSGVGFGWDNEQYKKWWPADVHIIGKGIIRFHAVYWPAFLMSAALPLPRSIFVHGYITSDGQKMSKSIGNVVDPFDLIKRYGAEPVRYYLLREIPAYADGDFSEERFREVYNADLANGLGNLVARITKLTEGYSFESGEVVLNRKFVAALDEFRFNDALESVWDEIRSLDKYISDQEPWTITDSQAKDAIMRPALEKLHSIAYHLQPFLPKTSETILASLNGIITKPPTLFPRLPSPKL